MASRLLALCLALVLGLAGAADGDVPVLSQQQQDDIYAVCQKEAEDAKTASRARGNEIDDAKVASIRNDCMEDKKQEAINPDKAQAANQRMANKAKTQEDTKSGKSCDPACGANGKCLNGMCVCDRYYRGTTSKPCQTYDPVARGGPARGVEQDPAWWTWYAQENPSKVSATLPVCEKACGPNGRCVRGACACRSGFAGDSCEELILPAICKAECKNGGTCSYPSTASKGADKGNDPTCKCVGGWEGEDCSQASCVDKCEAHSKCNLQTNTCDCDAGFEKTYKDSNKEHCTSKCNDAGTFDAQKDRCVCTDGRAFGRWCQYKSDGVTADDSCADKDNCNYPKGVCRSGSCFCIGGVSGIACNETVPDLRNMCASAQPGRNCSGHGACTTNQGCWVQHKRDPVTHLKLKDFSSCTFTCSCTKGWSGPACNFKACDGTCNVADSQGYCPLSPAGKCTCNAGFGGLNCQNPQCSNNCGGNGECIFTKAGGKCKCHQHWSGEDCLTSNVPVEVEEPNSCDDHWCSNNGHCNENTPRGHCICTPGFTGPNCTARDISCKPACSQHGVCSNGKCICEKNWAGKLCHVPTCIDACNGNGRCVVGKCICALGFLGDACETPGCPKQGCGFGAQCDRSKWRCDCRNANTTQLRLNRFGVCEQACPGTSGGEHPDGNSTSAAEKTAEEMTAPFRECSSHGLCVNASCFCQPGFSGDDCSVRLCPDTCSGHGTCNPETGACDCTDGYTGRGCHLKACSDPKCSGHGRCNSFTGRCLCSGGWEGTSCSDSLCTNGCTFPNGVCRVASGDSSGKCYCRPGFKGADCSISHCKCSGHGKCNNDSSVCQCSAGWTGAQCESRKCPLDCSGNGECSLAGECTCQPAFTGDACDQRTCMNCKKSSVAQCLNGVCICKQGFRGTLCDLFSCSGRGCSKHGACQDDGVCICEAGFAGEGCERTACKGGGNCSGHGFCASSGVCMCKKGYTGPGCQNFGCPNDCSEHGECDEKTHECTCDQGFDGKACDKHACPTNCNKVNSGGECNGATGKCRCLGGWGGKNCERRLAPHTTCALKCSSQCIETCHKQDNDFSGSPATKDEKFQICYKKCHTPCFQSCPLDAEN